MPHLDSYIPSVIYSTSICSEVLRFLGTALDVNKFVTTSNYLLKRMRKQANRHGSVISVLNKVFAKHFTVFNIFPDMVASFIKLHHCPEFKLKIYMLTSCIICCCCCCFFVFACFFAFFLVSLFVWLSCFYCFCAIYLCFFVFALIYVPMGWHFVL